MAHGLYNSRPIYDLSEEEERAYWQDFITHLQEMTGKRLKGRLGGGAGYTVRTDDAVTSYALSGDEAKARDAGCNGYVAKPFSPRELLAKIREFLPDAG
jgi:hypothetical protein